MVITSSCALKLAPRHLILLSFSWLQVREEIEVSGRDNPDNATARWEFNRSVLFERTNSMAETCGELASMIETLDSYYHFLSPELRAVTGDPQARPFPQAGNSECLSLKST